MASIVSISTILLLLHLTDAATQSGSLGFRAAHASTTLLRSPSVSYSIAGTPLVQIRSFSLQTPASTLASQQDNSLVPVGTESESTTPQDRPTTGSFATAELLPHGTIVCSGAASNTQHACSSIIAALHTTLEKETVSTVTTTPSGGVNIEALTDASAILSTQPSIEESAQDSNENLGGFVAAAEDAPDSLKTFSQFKGFLPVPVETGPLTTSATTLPLCNPESAVDCAGASSQDSLTTYTVYEPTTICPLFARDAEAQTTAPSLSPTNYAAVSTCLSSDACQPFLSHTRACFEALAPWTDPYDVDQSSAFRDCLCQTSDTAPFTPDSPFWNSFTESIQCLSNARVDTLLLASEAGQIFNFCHTQNPYAYLFIQGLQDWLHDLQKDIAVTVQPLQGAITTLVPSLSASWTTAPPLANLAYGSSAPKGGSLMGVSPSLTTRTTTETPFTFPVTVRLDTVTSLVTWVPLSTAGLSGFDAAAPASSVEGDVSIALASATATGSRSGIACAEKGVCVNSAASGGKDISLVVVLGVGLVSGGFSLW